MWCSLVLGVVYGCLVLALISSTFFGCGFRKFIIYNQDNSVKRFHLEYEMVNFTQGSLSVEEYFSGFQTLWADYCIMLMFPLQLSLLSAKCMPPASEINS